MSVFVSQHDAAPLRTSISLPFLRPSGSATTLMANLERPFSDLHINGATTSQDAIVDIDQDMATASTADYPEAPFDISLTQLLAAIREDVQCRQRSKARLDLLRRTQQSMTRNRNLASLSHQIRTTLVDCIRNEDKSSFTSLYKAAVESPISEPCSDFFQKLSPTAQACVTTFLDKLDDGDHVASCFSALSQKQLLNLLPTCGKAESIMSGHTRPTALNVDRLVDKVLLGSANCALDSICNIISEDVLAKVCARLISDQRHGNDKIMVYLLNRHKQDWSGRLMVQDWMLDIIHGGRFLLEPKTFRQRMDSAGDNRADLFLNEATTELLTLLPKIIPKDVRDFSHRILAALDPTRQRQYPAFVVTRWLFLSFLPDILHYPEAYGLLDDHIISEGMRSKILREICNRAQRIGLDVLHAWRHNRPCSDRDIASIHKVLALFQGQPKSLSVPTVNAVTVEDLLATMNALHPRAMDHNLGLQSSASSISGFSLFRATASAESILAPPTTLQAADDLAQVKEELEDIRDGMALLVDGQAIAEPRDEPVNCWWDETVALLRANPDITTDPSLAPHPQIIQMLEQASHKAESVGDLVEVHRLTLLQDKVAKHELEHGPLPLQCSVDMAFTKASHSAATANAATCQYQDLLDASLEAPHTTSLDVLRDKMWYTASARTSAEYERLQILITALSQMTKRKPAFDINVSAHYGGPNKLSSEQSVLVKKWIENNNIQILCSIDERIHRLCMEIRKVVEAWLGMDSPLLWEDGLYKKSAPRPFWPHTPSLSNTSSYEHIDAKSPSTNRSIFWSPTASASSATSVGSHHEPAASDLYCRLVGFVLSELILFETGSETDEALWTGMGGQLRLQASSTADQATVGTATSSRFDFRNAIKTMLTRFSYATNPADKLTALIEMQKLGGFQNILSDDTIRPKTLMRDLQYISSLLPTQDDAFWNAAIAALRIKDESIRLMVDTADAIIRYQTRGRGPEHARDAIFGTGAAIEGTMSDAAQLLTVAARDGNAAAQRELATLYLTHPDTAHVIAPFARTEDVFRVMRESKGDPLTMCVAHHWMLLSSKGGDGLAKEFLRQKEEMEMLP